MSLSRKALLAVVNSVFQNWQHVHGPVYVYSEVTWWDLGLIQTSFCDTLLGTGLLFKSLCLSLFPFPFALVLSLQKQNKTKTLFTADSAQTAICKKAESLLVFLGILGNKAVCVYERVCVRLRQVPWQTSRLKEEGDFEPRFRICCELYFCLWGRGFIPAKLFLTFVKWFPPWTIHCLLSIFCTL